MKRDGSVYVSVGCFVFCQMLTPTCVHLVGAVLWLFCNVCFQVSKYFSEIFKKLAPQGHAVLVMKKGEVDQQVCTSALPPLHFFIMHAHSLDSSDSGLRGAVEFMVYRR